MLGEDGGKMSKSKRNYREPNEIFDRYGADALRWYFFANQPPWTSIRYSEQAIKDCIPEFLLRLWNVYSFFVIYANIDGFDPAAEISGPAGQLNPQTLSKGKTCYPVSTRRQVDRWILSELNRTVEAVVERMDAFDNFAACQRLTEFVDALSNWFVRLSRDRFWSSERSRDKADAYWTLYECLLTVSKLIAPFTPFLAEAMWQNLAVAAFSGRPAAEQPPESVHLCDYPQSDAARIDQQLSERMALAREIVSLGRSARMGAKLKVRQPLSRVEVILADRTHQPWLEEHARMMADELNVKEVQFTQEADHYITYNILPDLKRLGPRLGKRLPAVRKLLAEADGGRLLAELDANGSITLHVARRADRARFRRHSSASSGQGRLGGRPGTRGGRGAGHGVDRGLDPRRARPRVGPHDSRPPQGDGLPVHRSDRGGRCDRFGRVAGGDRPVCRLHPRRNLGRRVGIPRCLAPSQSIRKSGVARCRCT